MLNNVTAIAPSFHGNWPYKFEESPNILICTPAYISKFIKGGYVIDEELFKRVQHLVLDEVKY